MSQRTEQNQGTIFQFPRNMESIHYKLTYRRDSRMQGSGDSILVLVHVYLVLSTTHYSRRVYTQREAGGGACLCTVHIIYGCE